MHLSDCFILLVAQETGVDPDAFEVAPFSNTPDPPIERIGPSFLSEMKTRGLGGELYSESLANVLALRVLRSHSSLGRSSSQRVRHESERGEGLSRRSLAQATDHWGAKL